MFERERSDHNNKKRHLKLAWKEYSENVVVDITFPQTN